MRTEAVLTPSELEIIQASSANPNLFTDYFFRPYGETEGWKFDHNFDPEGAWQVDLHGAAQKDITVIGGFGTGKTLGVAMSACVWCASTSDFKFLNVGPKAWQAKQMYDMVLLNARNTRFETLIWEKPRKPHPRIVLRFKVGPMVYESSLEFMSADKDATGILSWEGDWLHVDEAGLLDNLEEVIINVGSRLRGTVRGRERLGRFSMTSNSWDNYYLWYYFDLAVGDPDNFLSLVVSSRHNHNVTDDQLKRMLARIPKDERERFIDGTRPEGRGRFFDKQSVYACENANDIPFAMEQVEKGLGKWRIEKLYGAGVVEYRTPNKANRLYMALGDPGTGGAPHRNAPVWMVWDVTQFPSVPARLVAFWWGNGGGRIGPFVDYMVELMDLYKPVFTGIDSTGPQKNMAFLINEYLFKERFEEMDDGNHGFQSPLGKIRGVSGLDFSSGKKMSYLHACRLFIESQLLSWPKHIVGMRSQLTNYDPEKDRGFETKIAQDIVATMAMSAHVIRTWFHVSPEALLTAATIVVDPQVGTGRRSARGERERRSPEARPQEHIPREKAPSLN